MGNGGGGNMGNAPMGDNDVCNVCGLGGPAGITVLKPTTPDAKVTVPDRNDDGIEDEVSCRQLSMAGANGMIPAEGCDAMSQLVQASCACDVVDHQQGMGQGGGMGQQGGKGRRPGNRQDILGRVVSTTVIERFWLFVVDGWISTLGTNLVHTAGLCLSSTYSFIFI